MDGREAEDGLRTWASDRAAGWTSLVVAVLWFLAPLLVGAGRQCEDDCPGGWGGLVAAVAAVLVWVPHLALGGALLTTSRPAPGLRVVATGFQVVTLSGPLVALAAAGFPPAVLLAAAALPLVRLGLRHVLEAGARARTGAASPSG